MDFTPQHHQKALCNLQNERGLQIQNERGLQASDALAKALEDAVSATKDRGPTR